MRDVRRIDISQLHLWQITPARDILWLLAAAALIWIVYELREVLLPVLIAFVLADVFNPFITRMEERGWPRAVTATLIIAIVFGALTGFFVWLGPLLMDQFTGLTDKLPDYLKTLGKTYGVDVGGLLSHLADSIRAFQEEPRKILEEIFSTTGKAFGVVTFLFSRATSVLISILVAVIFFFLFAWRFNDGIANLAVFVPQSRRARVFAIVSRMDAAIGDFFRGRLVIAGIIAVLLSLGWFLTNVPYWFFLGVITGILTIVPYLSLLTWPVAILLKYVDALTGDSGAGLLQILVWPSLVYLVILFLEGWVLTPWIQSNQTEMSAATILLVVFIGGHFAGVWGLLFAIPVAACIKIIFNELVLPRIRRWAELK
ncbi:MAG TPA: AI-2E family transporter [Candidatus Binatia bacterium]|jgi:predicted PurR-regulated permease PerM